MTLKLNGSSSGYTAIDAPAAAGSNTLVLPTTNGSANQVLKTDGSGNLSWVDQPASVDNTPSWSFTRSGAWGAASGDWYLVPFNNAEWDTDSAFTTVSNGDTEGAKFTVPSGEAGKYVVHYGFGMTGEIDDGEMLALRIWKNGSHWAPSYIRDYSTGTNNPLEIHGSCIMNLAVGDYLQLYVYHNEGSGVLHNENTPHFSGFKLIGV